MSNFVRIASDDTAGCAGVVVPRTEFVDSLYVNGPAKKQKGTVLDTSDGS